MTLASRVARGQSAKPRKKVAAQKERKAEKAELMPEQLARYACNDCGDSVVSIGEFYMLKREIWQDQLGLGWNDNLCIGCLEKRLGRKISMSDMGSFPGYDWMLPTSSRLMDRYGFKRDASGKWRPKRASRDAGLAYFQRELIEDEESREHPTRKTAA